MVIQQQPDALSLSGNIKDLVISSSDVVRFRLYKGEDLLVDNQYRPDADGIITISMKEVVHSNLRFTLSSSASFSQDTLVGDFTAMLGDTDISFRAVKCGVANLHISASAFLSGNFLTWQPQVMEVRYAQPQWLTYYNASANSANIVVKSYLNDGGTATTVLAAVSSGQCVTVNTQFAHIWGITSGDRLGYFDVYVQDAVGNLMSYVQRYVMTENFPEDKFFLFENTLGGIDCAVFTGENLIAPSTTFENVQYNDTLESASGTIDRTYSQDTGYKSVREILWLKDFWNTKKAYAVEDGQMRSIVLTQSNVSASNMESLNSFTFSYKYAEDRGFQNLARVETLAAPLEIKTPDNLFFLAPRLAEFLEAELQDFLMIPVQSPFEPEWYKITVGALKSFVQAYALEAVAPSTHDHHNKAVLDQLTQGMIDVLHLLEVDSSGALRVKYNRDLRLGGKVVSSEGYDTAGFIGGIITGRGARIDGNGNGEMESLILRRFLEVPELRYNRVDVKVGDKWRAPGAGIIERVERDPDSDTGTCWLKLEEGEIGAVAVGDICMGIFHNFRDKSANATEDYDDGKGNRQFAGFCTVYFRVTEVLDYSDANGVIWRHKQFRYALRPVSNSWNKQFHPMEFMHFVAYGNFSNHDRQTSVYETRTYTRYLTSQNTWEIGIQNIARQDGDLKGLSTAFGVDASGYSSYQKNMYLTGVLKQVKEDGTPILTANDKGEWTGGTIAAYYDRFSYNGSLWLCVAEGGTNTVPAETDPAWLLQVRAGYSLSVSSKWSSDKTPYPENAMLTFAGRLVITNKVTSQPPYPLITDSEGHYITDNEGYYIMAADAINEDWYLLIDQQDIVNGKDGDGLEVRYSADAVNWHYAYNQGDIYMQQRVGDSSWSNAIRIVGEAGRDGVASEYTTFEFAVGTSMTEPPASGWTDGPQTVGEGEYLWMRTGIIVPPATEPESWSAYRIGGEKGDKGDGYTHRGEWSTDKMPALKMDVFRMGGAMWVALCETDNPPMWCICDASGNRLKDSSGRYILSGEVNSEEYSLALQDGEKGDKGDKGDKGEKGPQGAAGAQGIPGTQGIAGCIMRYAEWQPNYEWHNDESLTSGTRFLDIAFVRSASSTTGWDVYKCKLTHVSSASNAPGNTTYWEEFAINIPAIFVNIILAANAHIDLMQGNDLLIKKSDGTVTAGMSGTQAGGKTRMWAGATADNKDDAPFRVDESGEMWATNAHVEGEVNATSGNFVNVTISGALKSPYHIISAKSQWLSAYGDVYGYDGTSAKYDKLQVNPSVVGAYELYLTWGSDANGRTIKIRVGSAPGTIASGKPYIKVPSGYTLFAPTANVAAGASYALQYSMLYELEGFSDGWLIKSITAI